MNVTRETIRRDLRAMEQEQAVGASFVQLMGYGTGFLRAWWQRCVRGKDEFSAFEKNFYK